MFVNNDISVEKFGMQESIGQLPGRNFLNDYGENFGRIFLGK
jgi:hypothetical protein